MKKYILPIMIIAVCSLQGFSQSAKMPKVDGSEYEQMKEQGTLPLDIPIDTRTDEEKTRDIRAKLAEIHKTSPNIYTSGNEQIVTFGSHHRSPQPNPAGCGSLVPCGQGGGTVSNLTPCDDCSSAALPLGFNFCFYGITETQCYLNNNGNLSFSGPFFNFVPVPFPTVGYDMIAPFWADVQTNCPNAGTVCYEQTATHFIVTWTNVGYFACQTNYLNTFQVIITNGLDPILPSGNNVGVNYGQMQWTTGSASGGIGGFGGSSAIVGVNKGDGISYFQIGGFNAPGGTFFSASAVNNQVGWLTNKTFYFNACTGGVNANIPPICSTLNNCDTVRVCGLNDTAIIDALWLSPETGQTTWDVVNLNGLSGATILTNTPGNNVNTQVQVIGSAANAGYHVITFMAYDNGIPSDTTIINATIWIDTSSISPLNPVIGGVLALCGGDSTQLSVTPTNYDAYLWNTGSVNTSIWASTAGNYSVTCWLQGCQNTVSVNVQVHPNPVPSIVGPTITACGTGTTTLSSNATYATYLWSNGATTPSITVGGGSYSLMVTDTNGCSATTALTNVQSLPAPTIIAHNDTSFCSGTANLWVSFPGPALPTTCGLSSTGGCMGSSSSGIVGTGAQSCTDYGYPAPFGNEYTSVKQQYLYTAAELNAAGLSAGKIDALDFDVTLIDLANFTIPITTYHNFEVQMGCTNLTTFNQFPTAFETGLFVVYPSATYTVTGPTGWNSFPFSTAFEWDGVSNVIVQVCFSEYNGAANYTINCQTAMTATTNYASQEYLTDQQDACTAQTLGFWEAQMLHPDIKFHYCVAPVPSNFNYLWTAFPASGGVIANPTADSTSALTTAITDYQVTVTNINGGCTAIDTVHVGVINIAAMHITPAGPYCTASPIDTLQVSVPIGTGVFSGPGITDVNLGIFNPTLAGIGVHTIHYTVSAGPCGVGDTTIQVTVSNTLDPTIVQPPAVCTSYSPITLHAATAGGSWSGAGITDTINGIFNPASPGLVGNNVVTYTIYTPCYSRDTAIVTVVQQVDATINPVGGPYCLGSLPTQLTSIGAGGSWGGPGMSASGVFTPSLAGAGTFTIFHYLPGFCGDTATASITVIATPVISFVSNLTGGCEPTTIQFTSTVDQPGGTYAWNFGDGNTSSAANPSNQYLTYHGGIPYTVVLTYTNTNGCPVTDSMVGMISIHSQPEAQFNATPQPTDITQPEIHFHDHSTGVITAWNWSFGTGDTSGVQNPSYIYADTGTYLVQLIVRNAWCLDTAYNRIIIDPILTCYIPNAFSPDGNGENDEFKLSGTNIQSNDFTMAIFDRWGELIYYTNDLTAGWNGSKSNSGAPCELGVYVYKINLRDWKGLSHEYIGHVTLIK